MWRRLSTKTEDFWGRLETKPQKIKRPRVNGRLWKWETLKRTDVVIGYGSLLRLRPENIFSKGDELFGFGQREIELVHPLTDVDDELASTEQVARRRAGRLTAPASRAGAGRIIRSLSRIESPCDRGYLCEIAIG